MAHFSIKKYLRLAKGYYRTGKNCVAVMIPRVHKALMRAYINRRVKKRELRRDWISIINASVREHSVSYSQFIYGLNRSNIKLDRKILQELGKTEPYSFKAIVDEVKIQGKLKEIESEKLTYIQAFSKKLLIQGPLKDAEKNELEPMPYFHGDIKKLEKSVKEIREEQEKYYYTDFPKK